MTPKCKDTLSSFLKEGILRVKYLDQRDIESLDWKFEKSKLKKNFIDRFKYKQYTLEIRYSDCRIIIDKDLNAFTEYPNILFYGIIKNKSELMKLLTQLEIE